MARKEILAGVIIVCSKGSYSLWIMTLFLLLSSLTISYYDIIITTSLAKKYRYPIIAPATYYQHLTKHNIQLQ